VSFLLPTERNFLAPASGLGNARVRFNQPGQVRMSRPFPENLKGDMGHIPRDENL
jgi:hypothetical protein